MKSAKPYLQHILQECEFLMNESEKSNTLKENKLMKKAMF